MSKKTTPVFLKEKQIKLHKVPNNTIILNIQKFKNTSNTISLIYNLKNKQKRVWHNNYQKKCHLRNKKEHHKKQLKLSKNSIKFLLHYRKNKKKKPLFKKQWYHYNEKLYSKKMKFNYYQSNFLKFYNKKVIRKFL